MIAPAVQTITASWLFGAPLVAAAVLTGCSTPRADLAMMAGPSGPQEAAAQPTPAPLVPAQPDSAEASFLAAIQGRWVGPMYLNRPAGQPQEFWMELAVAPMGTAERKSDPRDPQAGDRFTWTITYARGKDVAEGRQDRPYELVVVDPARGRYDVDEKNGIIIPMAQLGPTLASAFAVGGSRLIATYQLGETTLNGEPQPMLDVEIYTHADDDGASTGGKEGVPEVKVWIPATLQRARLMKVHVDATK